jgi:predicted metal-dependent hydrolase
MESTPPTKRRSIQYGTTTVSYDLRFAPRKTLSISVLPDLSVLVTAPEGKSLEAIESKVRKRAGWILKQQNYFRDFLPAPKPRRYVSGETHRFLGRQYRLKVQQADIESVKLKGAFIHVGLADTTDGERIKKLVTNWFRSRAESHFAASVDRSLERFGKRMAVVPAFALKRMKNRWGSVGENGVIYLNPELVTAPRACIDYVVTHELCHLLVPDHSQKFFSLMEKVMPDWEHWKQRLELSTRG